MRHLRSERGSTAADYLGVLFIVATIVFALAISPLGGSIAGEAGRLICVVAHGGDSAACEESTEAAGPQPENCLLSSSKSTANFRVFVGVVEVGKDSILIREDFADGTSKFTLIDGTSVDGELFAGAKAKVGRLGLDLSAEASAGGRLKGAKVFVIPTASADEFEDKLKATGGFDGILRDVAGLNDSILGIVPNPLGGLDDGLLDILGVEDDEDLPKPTEEYIDAALALGGEASAGLGAGLADGSLKGTLEAAGGAKVTHSGKDAGKVELYYAIEGTAAGNLAVDIFGGSLGGKAKFVATLILQDGKPARLKLTGAASYNGALDLGRTLKGDRLGDLKETFKKISLKASEGEGQAVEVATELDLSDPQNLQAALALLQPNPGAQIAAVPGLIERIDEAGRITVDTFNIESSESDGEVKVGIGVGGGAGGTSSSEDRERSGGYVREPGGTFLPRVCMGQS